jgi:hypothetical protein
MKPADSLLQSLNYNKPLVFEYPSWKRYDFVNPSIAPIGEYD